MQPEYKFPSRITTFCLLPLLSSLTTICSPLTIATSVILFAHCIGWNLRCLRRWYLSCLSGKVLKTQKSVPYERYPEQFPVTQSLELGISGSDSTKLTQMLNKPCGSEFPNSTCLYLPLCFLYHILALWLGRQQTYGRHAAPLSGNRRKWQQLAWWQTEKCLWVFAWSQRLLELWQPMPLREWTHKESRVGSSTQCQIADCPGHTPLSQDLLHSARRAWSSPGDQRITQKRFCSLRWSDNSDVWLSDWGEWESSDYGDWVSPNLCFHGDLIQLRAASVSGGSNLSLWVWSRVGVYTDLPRLRGA